MARSVQRRSRITVIDDHAEFLALLHDVLSTEHDVTTLSGGDITPEGLVASRPDMLIVDMHLDRENLQGRDIVTLARAHRDLRTIPIVVCSADGRGLNGHTDGFLSSGNTAVLSKPFALDTLEELIRLGLAAGFDATSPSTTLPDGFESRIARSTDALPITEDSLR